MNGSGSNISAFSYIAVGREAAYGTYVTSTSGIDFLSGAIKTTKEGKILEEIQRSRTQYSRLSLSKKVEGEIELYYRPDSTACGYFLENAFGGSVTSTELTTGASYSHEFNIGSMDLTNTALSINARKGDDTNGNVFEYTGARINELSFSAELDDALKMSLALICKDSTQTANDVEDALTISAQEVFSFVGGRFSIAATEASLTSTSYWHVQNIDFKLANNLKADNDSRRIGSDVLEICPVGIASMELGVGMRYDTITAYDAMMDGTVLAGEFEFEGDTLTGSSIRKSLTLTFPRIYVNDAGDPEIGGPDEILKSDVSFHVLRNTNAAAGFACKALLINGAASI